MFFVLSLLKDHPSFMAMATSTSQQRSKVWRRSSGPLSFIMTGGNESSQIVPVTAGVGAFKYLDIVNNILWVYNPQMGSPPNDVRLSCSSRHTV